MLLLLHLVLWTLAESEGSQNVSAPEDSQRCGGPFNSTEFHLEFPGSLLTPRCDWSVEATSASICGLTLELGTLRLPSCPSDQLVVGETALCGNLPSIVHLPFQPPRTNITARNTGDGELGFNITVRQTSECKSHLEHYRCGGEFLGDTVVIISPGYPSSYPPGADCRYTIRRSGQDVCQVEVAFENSSLERSEGCTKDRVEIRGDRLCGELQGVRTYEIGETLDIRFVTDWEGSGMGFRLLARQIQCADTVPIVVDAPEENDKHDVLVDCISQGPPDFPPSIVEDGYPRFRRPYPPFPLPVQENQNIPLPQDYSHPDNSYRIPTTITVPSIPSYPQNTLKYPSPTVSFRSTENIPPNAYLPPGISRMPNEQGLLSSPPNVKYYPNNFPNSYRPIYTSPNIFPLSQSSITPLYQSQQCCGHMYTDSHFLIVSPGFPRSQDSDCIYTIQRYSPTTFQLRFQFRYFWVGQDTGTGCSGGALEIEGARICGCKTGIIWTSQFLNSEPAKVLHLRLDSSIDRLFNGFVIEVYQDDSYLQRYKRTEYKPKSGQVHLSDGRVVNFTQYVETVVEREPLTQRNGGNQFVDNTHSQLVWDQNRQTWTSPTDWFCLRWSFQDWLLLAKEALWSRYQCPASASVSSPPSVVDSSRFDITACRTCNYFCRQNCQCC